ncbi:hypothetical protein DW015_12440 [Ruminococcus sp. AF37-20]|nr:hypothetical protein DW015_12440 [Ruminococcus sp. AF37-20]
MLIFIEKTFKSVVIAALNEITYKALFYEQCGYYSVLVRKGKFSLKHYCILKLHSQEQKTYAKTSRFAQRILLPHFSLGIAEIRRTQPTQIVRTSNLPVTKKAVGCVRESHGKGGIT